MAACGVGVDLGYFSTVVALSSPAKSLPETVGNRLSHGSTPSIVSFYNFTREVGEEAENHMGVNAANTIAQLPSLLKDIPLLRSDKKRFRYLTGYSLVQPNEENSGAAVVIPVQYANRSWEVYPENILAPFFRYLLEIVKSHPSYPADESEEIRNGKGIGIDQNNGVESATISNGGISALEPKIAIALPFLLNENSMRLLQRALSMAGFPRDVSVIQQYDAVFNWWIQRHSHSLDLYFRESEGDFVNSPDFSKVIAIVDVGFSQSSCQIIRVSSRANYEKRAEKEGKNAKKQCLSEENEDAKLEEAENAVENSSRNGVASSSKEEKKAFNTTTHTFEVLAAKTDDSLGTYDMIVSILEDVKEKKRPQFDKENVSNSGRSDLKLFSACEKLLRDLSGLKESSFELEAFFKDESNLSYHLSRNQFDVLCEGFRDSLSKLFSSALIAACVAPEEVFSVELIGGGCRIPWVQRSLEMLISEGNSSFGDEGAGSSVKLRKTLDGSSSVSFGAAFMATKNKDLHADLVFSSNLSDEDAALQAKPKDIEDALLSIELAEFDRRHHRDKLESYILELKAGMSSVNGHLLDTPEVKKCIQEAERFLDDEGATPSHQNTAQAYKETLSSLMQKLQEVCPEYFKALEDEKARVEEEIQANSRLKKSTADLDVKLPNSQCLKKAQRNKDEGNELFKIGNYELAVNHYVRAVQYLAKITSPNEEEEKSAREVKIATNLNLSQCYLKIPGESSFKRAVNACNIVLELDPENLKALFRRSLAHEGLNIYEKAMEDATKGSLLSPEDSAFSTVKERIKRKIAAQERRERQMYARMMS